MNEEIWKDIEGYEGYYQISSRGRVLALERNVSERQRRKEKLRAITVLKTGYARVILYKEFGYKIEQVHRLVANAFIPNPENKPQVNHINSIRNDNRVENLSWVTSSENRIHGIKFGNVKTMAYWTGKKGKDHPLSKTIIQMTMDLEYVNEFIGTENAEIMTGIGRTNIARCCREISRSAGGYKWKYKVS